MIDSHCDNAALFHNTQSSNRKKTFYVSLERGEKKGMGGGGERNSTRAEVLYLPWYKWGEERCLMGVGEGREGGRGRRGKQRRDGDGDTNGA